ncbi:MMPL family transporter [Paenibacillus sp. FSL R7-0345]|uniref:MMPL family transporter n=1 Tax=Paenibacillus sp. FSL R7-0345 TaxID=2954535 RepID=UPI003159A6C3
MKKLKSWRTLSLLLWVIVTVLMITTMPDMNRLVKEKGQISIPDDAQSSVAAQMIKQMNPQGGEAYGIIAVFNSGSDNPLTAAQKEQIAAAINDLKAKEQVLGITGIVAHTDSPEVEQQLVSEDQTTILTQISVDENHGEIAQVADELNTFMTGEGLQQDGIKTYLTGSGLIGNDFANSTQDGVKKTEVIAIVFILAVLIIVFRSPVVPLISLLTVGISYLVSLGVTAQLVDHFSFPFSSFTQVFLVVVLFGVGTDYNILLYTRFKEELAHQDDVYAAVKATMKSAAKTVLFSGLAVMIGFASLFLAKFNLYQATSGVAIGVLVLLLVLVTLNPFFMILLGKKMFWPVRKFDGHGDSRLWGMFSKTAAARSIMAIVLVAVLTVPFILKYSNVLNFNDLWEVSDKYESKQGINVIEDHFPPGFSSPATLVIRSDSKLDQASTLHTLDEVAERIAQMEGVSEVMSPTRPTGSKIQELYINDQTRQVNSGLGDANNGIGEINEGLSSAEEQLGGSGSDDLDNVQKLIDGTGEVQEGVSALRAALDQVTSGMNSGAAGAGRIEDGLSTLNTSVGQLAEGTLQLYNGYSQLEAGLGTYEQYFSSIAQAITGAAQGYEQIEGLMNNLVAEKPEMAEDPNVMQTLGIAASAKQQLSGLSGQLEQLRTGHQTAMASFKTANDSLSQINGGLKQMQSGVAALQTGASSLQQGLNKGADGSARIADQSGQLETGLKQINDGQVQLLQGLNDLQGKMGELQSGLSASTEGLTRVSTGLETAQSYLSKLSESETSEKFYIPDDVLNGEEFQTALNTYMSEDRTTATMTIILDQNPFSAEAMPVIAEISRQVDAALSGTNLSGAKAAINGTTARNADLNTVSQEDFVRTAVIMMIGIAVVLIFITRSLLNSLFIVGSLILVYFTSLGLGELVSAHLFNADLLSWNVPFFSFIMIVALGVDYSIFVMMRYNELQGTPAERIVKASRDIGSVVLSAALILGGTFAALIPSGVLTLIQVAIVVIIGLLLLSLIAMPILLPALIGLSGRFKRKEAKYEMDNNNTL